MAMQYNLHQAENVWRAHRDAQLKREVCEALFHGVAQEVEHLEVQVVNGSVHVFHPCPDSRLQKLIRLCLSHIDGILELRLRTRPLIHAGGLAAPQWI